MKIKQETYVLTVEKVCVKAICLRKKACFPANEIKTNDRTWRIYRCFVTKSAQMKLSNAFYLLYKCL